MVLMIPTFSGGGQPFYQLDPRITLCILADKIHTTPERKRKFRRLWKLRRLIQDYQPDVVVSFLPNVNVAAIAATVFTGIPCVIGERSDPIEQPIGRFWTTACKMLYRYADAITVQTDSVAQRIETIYGGLKRVTVMPNPLPEELTNSKPRDPDVEARTGRHVFLSVGRLAAEKRPDRIIEAFVQVAGSHPGWDLHLIGEGPLRPRLEKQIDRCGLEPGRVRLLGRTNDPWTAMYQADAFVMASAYEGFPNALLEAVAIGLPSVSTDCRSGPREISDNGNLVRLVPTEDKTALASALDEVMGDRGLRRRLCEDGPVSVRRRFSLPLVLNLWDRLFESLPQKTRS
jgi:glycosyltransferase involved in cell wall biosynthesis